MRWGLEISEEITQRGVGVRISGDGVEKMMSNLRWYCYEALYVHKSGVYGRENVSSTKILLANRKICSGYLSEARLKHINAIIIIKNN